MLAIAAADLDRGVISHPPLDHCPPALVNENTYADHLSNKQGDYMKAFRLTEIALGHPVTIIAEDNAHAARMVVQALTRGFGQMPQVHYSISEWITAASPDREARAAEGLTEIGEPGFVQEHERFWDTHDPFEEF